MSKDTLEKLQSVIKERKKADPGDSYVAQLFTKGRQKMAQKVAEEGTELAIAAVSEGRQQIVSEAADLLFHILILLEETEVSFNDVLEELEKREGTSGLEEKAKRKD